MDHKLLAGNWVISVMRRQMKFQAKFVDDFGEGSHNKTKFVMANKNGFEPWFVPRNAVTTKAKHPFQPEQLFDFVARIAHNSTHGWPL